MSISILNKHHLSCLENNWRHRDFKQFLKSTVRRLKEATEINNTYFHPVVKWLLVMQASGEMTNFTSAMMGHAGNLADPRYLDEAVGLLIGLTSWPHQSSIEYINLRYKELHEFFDALYQNNEDFEDLVDESMWDKKA